MPLSNKKTLEILDNSDTSTLKEVIDNYTKTLYNFIRRFGFDNEETEDILQDVFIKIWKHEDSFIKEKSSLKTWIFTITKNTIYDTLRKKKNIIHRLSDLFKKNEGQTIEDIEDVTYDIIKLLEQESARKILLTAIEELDATEKSIFFLHHEESLTFHEISLIFNSPLNTIKSKYRRSLLKLKTKLEYLHQNT